MLSIGRMRAEFQTALGQLLEMGYQVAATPGTAEYYIAQSKGSGGGDSNVGDADRSDLTHSPPYFSRLSGADSGSAVDSSALFAHIAVLAKPTDSSISSSSSSSADTSNRSPSPAAGSVLDWIKERKIDLVINIPEGSTRGDEVTSGYLMRRAAVDFGTSLLTNIKYSRLALPCLVLSCLAALYILFHHRRLHQCLC